MNRKKTKNIFILSILKELDAVANELLSEFVVNKIDLNNQHGNKSIIR
jgi:hypothetical protein